MMTFFMGILEFATKLMTDFLIKWMSVSVELMSTFMMESAAESMIKSMAEVMKKSNDKKSYKEYSKLP